MRLEAVLHRSPQNTPTDPALPVDRPLYVREMSARIVHALVMLDRIAGCMELDTGAIAQSTVPFRFAEGESDCSDA